MAKQQIYFTKETGPGLWQALRQLKDNPIAHYGLLQTRRRAARAPQWRKRLVLTLVVLACAGLSPFVLRLIIKQIFHGGYYSLATAGPMFEAICYALIILTLSYSIWLALGIFTAIRDAVLVLASHRSGTLSTVDELVAISSLSNTEILAGTLKLLIIPPAPRILLGAGLPLITSNCILLLNKLAQIQHRVYTGSSGYTNYYTQSEYLLNNDLYSLKSLLIFEMNNVLSFFMIALLGLIALVILLLLIIVCGRRTGNHLMASITGFLYTTTQLIQYAVFGNLTIVQLIFIEYLWQFDSTIEMIGITMLFGLVTGPIIVFMLIRLLRNSYILRSSTLVAPALAVFAASAWASTAIYLDGSWLSYLALPLGCVAPGFGALAFATGLVDQLAAPVLPMFSLIGNNNIEYTFNTGWLIKLGCQAMLLPLLFIMARDAVRLYRQPGLL